MGLVTVARAMQMRGSTMAVNGQNSFGIRDNHTRGKIADFLVEKINAESHLSVVLIQ